ncbi:hypothetical protein MsAg5_01410 [Methanosarcinaceae archaeon Ag5]|uniref:Uncharacterized protein n=1 Tax=Methanolapillus africanus TaxID=3028297 RepID=A0AAE4MHX3_9EURY|nr:hypothetical protein [Methanosarcinaceae archaeon Ag5]
MFERFLSATLLNFYYLGNFLISMTMGTICVLFLLAATALIMRVSTELGLENDYWSIVLKNIAGFSSVALLIFFTGIGIAFVLKDFRKDLKKETIY